MNRLDMTMEEAELVRGMLKNHLATLDMEIDHTDRRDYKKMLHERRQKVAGLLERCSALLADDTVGPQDTAPTH